MTRRNKPRIPSYRLHKPSGRAVVRLDGRDVYLGKYGTPESEATYHRVIAEWSANCQQVHQHGGSPARPDRTVNEIAVPYWRFAQDYYRKNGKPTSEVFSIKRALGPLVELYGTTPVSQFGPLALKTYRETLIESGLTRGVINNHVGRVKRMFKWATENELVPAGVHHALQAVGGLRRGRSAAKETQPIRPVDDTVVDATIAHVNRHVATMIQLQRLTGMRPGEVAIMRGRDLDTTGRVWTYTPASHKTEHHGRRRVIFLGPRAQQVIAPFLKKDLQQNLFSPREAMIEVRRERRARRVTPMTPSQRKRRPKRKPKRTPGDQYTVCAYEHAIRSGCKKAFPAPEGLNDEQERQWRREHQWSPNQLRHSAATYLRKEFGIEAARVVLAHASPTKCRRRLNRPGGAGG